MSPLGDGTRYDGSMKAIDHFLDIRKGDAFGLTFFGNNVLHWVPLTSDPSAIRCAPPFMKPENVPYWMGGTMIGKALLACKEILTSREEGDRMIILVSDGESFDLSGGNDESIAQTLKRSNIAVYAIHISDRPPPPTIVNVTALTGGEVFAVDDPGALTVVFQRIDAMRETRLEKTASELMDNFVPVCIAGLLLLGLSGCAPLWPEVHPMVMHAELAALAVAILALAAESLHAAPNQATGPAGLWARAEAGGLGSDRRLCFA